MFLLLCLWKRRCACKSQSLWAKQIVLIFGRVLKSVNKVLPGTGKLSKIGVFRNAGPLSVEVCVMDCCCCLLVDFQKHSVKRIVIDLWNEYKPIPVVILYLGQGKIGIFLEHYELLLLAHQIEYRYFIVQNFNW